MPVILIGALVGKYEVFDHVMSWLEKHLRKCLILVISILVFVICIVGKALFQHYTGVSTNMDAIFIVPFMFCTIYVIKRIFNKFPEKALRLIGGISLYIWMMHRVFLYEPIRTWTLSLRLPILIVIVAIVILVPLALLFKYIDKKIDKLIYVKRFKNE